MVDISSLNGIFPGLINSYETADALVFFVDSNEVARRIRDSLLSVGYGTKILPEAVTWHFAKHWSHMTELCNTHHKLDQCFPLSSSYLSRAVSLPISLKATEQDIDVVASTISGCL